MSPKLGKISWSIAIQLTTNGFFSIHRAHRAHAFMIETFFPFIHLNVPKFDLNSAQKLIMEIEAKTFWRHIKCIEWHGIRIKHVTIGKDVISMFFEFMLVSYSVICETVLQVIIIWINSKSKSTLWVTVAMAINVYVYNRVMRIMHSTKYKTNIHITFHSGRSVHSVQFSSVCFDTYTGRATTIKHSMNTCMKRDVRLSDLSHLRAFTNISPSKHMYVISFVVYLYALSLLFLCSITISHDTYVYGFDSMVNSYCKHTKSHTNIIDTWNITSIAWTNSL